MEREKELKNTMLRSIKRNILKNKLKRQGVEKINKRFSEFWMQIRLKMIKRQQKLGLYRKDKDPHIIYYQKKRQGQGSALGLKALYPKCR